ncbi:MAG: KilA-N domain-containing protein [Eubacteriales bacterium]
MDRKSSKETIHAKGLEIEIYTDDFKNEFISITDIAKYKGNDPFIVINNWMRTKDTIEFIGLWEQLHNPNFKPIEFDRFKNEAGFNAFTLSPKRWVEATKAIGIRVASGRYGGTYAHSDIAFEFASWVSAEFKLYIIQDYQRLKVDENSRLSLNWNLNREISKLNYRFQTDAIKQNLLPRKLSNSQISITYANEADVLNIAIFCMTAKEWRDQNPSLIGNIRDYATLNQLLVLSNMESYNAILISQDVAQNERLKLLNKLAIRQLEAIEKINTNPIKIIGFKPE